MKPECIKNYYDNGNVGYERWYLNGKYHREDGPAVISYYYENGNVKSEYWFLNDKYHREDGPAVISYYDNGNVRYERWILNDKLHREDGPAVIDYYDNGKVEYERWYLNGFKYMPEDYLIEIPKEELDKLNVLRKFAFVKIDNEYVFIKHLLRQDKEFYNKYKILF